MPPKSKPKYTELKRNQLSILLGDLGAVNQIDRCYCVRTEPVHHYCVRHSETRMAVYANDRLAAACVYPRVHGSMRLSAVAGYPTGVVCRKPTRKNLRKLFRHSVLRSLIKIRGISGANGISGPGPVHRNAISSNYVRDKPPFLCWLSGDGTCSNQC